MHTNLEERLCQKYPILFRSRESGDGTLIGTGCDCSNGWYDILVCASSVIAAHEEGKGLPLGKRTQFVEVKEKYGELRVYLRGFSDSFVDGVIDHLEHLSKHLCEACGEPGRMRKRTGWYGVRCDDCVVADPHPTPWEDVNEETHDEFLDDALQGDLRQLRLTAKAQTSIVAIGDHIADFYRGRIIQGSGWKPPKIVGVRTFSDHLEFQFSEGFDADSEVAGWVALTEFYAAMHLG